jgi:pSer/pThr/pTyr-binding forkhead associated (FHA) protein
MEQAALADEQQPPTMAGGNPHFDPAQEPSMPSIRFTPFIDLRSNRESLRFAPIERCLRTKDERIKVGRASDRDSGNPCAPVGFGSKVVSRRHCEFWWENGQWFVKDVKSSSGTFLNHIRLSAPGMESKPYPLNDGDILQLGIDFKGGEEQIFRCVKIRVELNRTWQKGFNNFKYAINLTTRHLWRSTY